MNVEHFLSSIDKAQSIVLLTHYDPDFDGAGVCYVLARWLRKRKKIVEVIYPNSPLGLEFLSDQPVSIGSNSINPDLILICDTNDVRRIYHPDSFNSVTHIVIDHHIGQCSIEGTHLIDPLKGSTAELLVTEFLPLLDEMVDAKSATVLLCSILYDTNCLKTMSTSLNTFKVIEILLEKGGSFQEALAQVQKPISSAAINLWGHVLETCTYFYEKQVAVMVIDQDFLVKKSLEKDLFRGFINAVYPLFSSEIIIFAYRRTDGILEVSMRSRGHDVALIARNFGGGGHMLAAGFKALATIEELIQVIDRFYRGDLERSGVNRMTEVA